MTRTVYRGADLLRRTFIGDDSITEEGEESEETLKLVQTRPSNICKEHKGTPLNIKLLERLQTIGIENLMATPTLTPPTLPGGVYTRRKLSPMEQLTSLKTLSGATPASPQHKTTKDIKKTDTLPRSPKKRQRPTQLGVPGRPGSGALKRSIGQLQKILKERPELGTVGPRRREQVGTPVDPNADVGQLSALSIGRKGGFL